MMSDMMNQIHKYYRVLFLICMKNLKSPPPKFPIPRLKKIRIGNKVTGTD